MTSGQQTAGSAASAMADFGSESGLSPYAAGRAEYDRQNSDLLRAKARWQLIAFTLAAMTALLTGANLKLALRGELIPYVVEVDRHDEVVAYGPAEALDEPEQRLVVSEIGRLVRNLRSVYSDPVAQQDRISEAYAYTTDQARTYLDAYLSSNANNPVLLGRTINRMVEVTSVLPVPESRTWKVRWSETEIPLEGGAQRISDWEGYFELEIMPTREAEVFRRNPLGLYVASINWSRIGRPRENSPPSSNSAPSEAARWAGTQRGTS